MQLEVNNGTHTDIDDVYIISSVTSNVVPTVSILTPTNNAQYYDGEIVKITALASDLNGSIKNVDFFANGDFIATATASPYSIDWAPAFGNYELTAIVFDFDNASSMSNVVNVAIVEAPSCNGTSWDGDFGFVFSDDKNNPTLTFIPSKAGVGTPTCILYYGTNSGTLPGYGVNPNVPFKLNASEGQIIYFYYTYSFPGFVEKNNSTNKNSYVIGSCKTSTSIEEFQKLNLKFYPNPVTDLLNIELPEGKNQITIYNLAGALLHKGEISQKYFTYNMNHLSSGMYFVSVVNNDRRVVVKVIKQ